MKAKILVLTVSISTLAFFAKAQESTTFGIRAGVNFQNINGKDQMDDKLENDLKTGFHVGVNAEVPVAPDFYLQPGVLFTTKGAKIDEGGIDYKVNISYIEVPINFLYKPVLGTGKLLLGIGPYVAFGIGGKLKDSDSDADEDIKFEKEITQTQYVSAPSNYAYLKRFDAGGNLLFGYEMSNKVSVQLNAQLGLVNINPEIEGISNDNTKFKNTGFGVSLGYRL